MFKRVFAKGKEKLEDYKLWCCRVGFFLYEFFMNAVLIFFFLKKLEIFNL